MIYVGIDVAKDKHDCHVFDSDGVILCDYFTFANSLEGFGSFERLLASCVKKSASKSKAKVGLESTGHYSTNLLSFLSTLDCEIVLFNPLIVSQSKKAASLRRTKTDKNDSRYIAQLLIADKSKTYHQQSYTISALKSITRARFRLIKELQPLKNRYARLIHIVFPELCEVFCKTDIISVLKLLQELPGAKAIAACDIRTLATLLKENSHGKLARAAAEKLKAASKTSIGICAYNPGDALELSLTAERIIFLHEQKGKLEAEMRKMLEELGSPITSITGIGIVTGATILAEIGDIKNFSSAAKLLAYAGAEPSTYQSGRFTATNTPMVKHGSKYLRNALFQATTSAFLHSPSMRDYIQRKQAQGKHYYVAVSHGMKRMTRLIFSVLTNNLPFTEPTSL